MFTACSSPNRAKFSPKVPLKPAMISNPLPTSKRKTVRSKRIELRVTTRTFCFLEAGLLWLLGERLFFPISTSAQHLCLTEVKILDNVASKTFPFHCTLPAWHGPILFPAGAVESVWRTSLRVIRLVEQQTNRTWDWGQDTKSREKDKTGACWFVWSNEKGGDCVTDRFRLCARKRKGSAPSVSLVSHLQRQCVHLNDSCDHHSKFHLGVGTSLTG